MENEIIWARRIAMTFTDDHPFRFIIVTLMTTLNSHTRAYCNGKQNKLTLNDHRVRRSARAQPTLSERI